MKDYVSQSAALARNEAVRLRDAGNIGAARGVLSDMVGIAESAGLDGMAMDLAEEAAVIDDDSSWNSSRKTMRAKSNSMQNQQMSAPVK